jgi:hypothetical protein
LARGGRKAGDLSRKAMTTMERISDMIDDPNQTSVRPHFVDVAAAHRLFVTSTFIPPWLLGRAR